MPLVNSCDCVAASVNVANTAIELVRERVNHCSKAICRPVSLTGGSVSLQGGLRR